jgi:uncharacterized protein (TIGR00725 family)
MPSPYYLYIMEDTLPRPLIKNIAFFGGAAVRKDDPVYKAAYEIAKILASENYTIVNGGGPGVMDAATHGAEAVGGETLTVTFYPENAPGFEGRYVGNIPDREIVTTNYIDRMFKLLEHGDMFIIFKGGSGTISEFGAAWVLAKLYHGHHKPFILYGKFWHEIINVLKEKLILDKNELSVFEIVEKKEDILPTIRKIEHELSKLEHSHCKVCREKAFMT